MSEALAATGRVDEGRAIMERHLGERSDPTPDGIALRTDYVVTQLVR
jgi:hypothetical protein